MQFKASTLLSIVASAQFALAAYVPSEPWSTLTPSAPAPTGAVTDYASTFGIAVSRVESASGLAKRAVTQIGDGQVQATTGTETRHAVTQIGDGQVQATTNTRAPVTQIGDGQVQATTNTRHAVTQIGDGQVQATTNTRAAVTQIGDGQIQATTNTRAAVTQIGDGQIQATTNTRAAVTQIGDGQIQATTATHGAVTQIGDGQIQATTATHGAATQITDGQVQATSGAAEAADGQITNPVENVSCYTEDTLALTLRAGVLEDSHQRIGSIVANHQFQFDGPTPQAGAIYAAGWSITQDGLLAIGNSSTFYECLSGTFYNLYDQDIGSECYEIVLQVVDLVDC